MHVPHFVNVPFLFPSSGNAFPLVALCPLSAAGDSFLVVEDIVFVVVSITMAPSFCVVSITSVAQTAL